MGNRILMLLIAILATGAASVAASNPGNPRRMLLQKRGTEQAVPVGYMIRQPVSFLGNTHECVEYSVSSKGKISRSEIPILTFLMTEAQMTESDQVGVIVGDISFGSYSSNPKTSRSLDYIEGSECVKADCQKVVNIPKDGLTRPFYLVLVNADHTKPEFDQTRDEIVDVIISVRGIECPTPDDELPVVAPATKPKDRKTKKSGTDIAVIIIPIVVILILVLILASLFIIRQQHRKTVMDLPKDNVQAKREAPLTTHHSDDSNQQNNINRSFKDTPPTTLPIVAAVDEGTRQGMFGAEKNSEDRNGWHVDGPIPPPDYEPPATRNSFEEDRYNVYEEHKEGAPKQVFNNTLWGRLSSFRNSVTLRSMQSLKDSKGTGLKSASSWKKPSAVSDVEEGEEREENEGSQRNNTVINSFEEDVAPSTMMPDASSSSDDEDLVDGVAVAPAEEEEPDKKKTKVFVNNMYTRMKSSFKSFGSIGSFGSRKRSSGVKMRTMNSMAKWAGRNTLKKGQDDVQEVSEGSEHSEAELPPQQQPIGDEHTEQEQEEEEKLSKVIIPGAEHLSDSDSGISASPLAPTPFQQMTQISGRISE